MMDVDQVQQDAEARALAGVMALIGTDERRELVIRDLLRHARRDVRATLQGCDLVMGALRDKLPEPVFRGGAPTVTSQRDECEFWAEFASDGQIAAMLVACLDRIGGTRAVLTDRKRLFVALWNGLPPEDRKAFRARVLTENTN